MRVLVLNDKKENIIDALEVVIMGYEEDIEVLASKRVTGLYMLDIRGNEYYIEGMSKEDCNAVTRLAVERGYCDLTSYGEYNFITD